MAGSVATSHFVGRTAELDRLRAAFESTRVGDPVTLCVGGEAGVGKTRLVTRFTEQVSEAGGLVLVGGCIELGEGSLPYGPVIQALRGLGRRLDSAVLADLVGPDRALLARMLPEFGAGRATRPSRRPASRVVGSSSQARLFEAFLGLLERLGETIPDSVGDRGPALGRPLDSGLAHVFGPQPADGIAAGADLPHRRPAPPPSGPSLPRRTGPQRAS